MTSGTQKSLVEEQFVEVSGAVEQTSTAHFGGSGIRRNNSFTDNSGFTLQPTFYQLSQSCFSQVHSTAHRKALLNGASNISFGERQWTCWNKPWSFRTKFLNLDLSENRRVSSSHLISSLVSFGQFCAMQSTNWSTWILATTFGQQSSAIPITITLKRF